MPGLLSLSQRETTFLFLPSQSSGRAESWFCSCFKCNLVNIFFLCRLPEQTHSTSSVQASLFGEVPNQQSNCMCFVFFLHCILNWWKLCQHWNGNGEPCESSLIFWVRVVDEIADVYGSDWYKQLSHLFGARCC